MVIRGIGRKPLTGRRIPWRHLSLSMSGEARRFLQAAGHTWDVDAQIIGSLVRGLQDAGTWTKYLAIYPFYPARAASANNHRWNLCNPQDTNGAFRITWSGTVTHASAGISSASSGYGNTNLVASTAGISASSVSLCAYCTQDPVNNAIQVGAENAGVEWALSAGTPNFYPAITSEAVYPFATIAAGGYFVATRTDGTTIRGYQNGAEIVNAAQGSAAALTTNPFFVLASNIGSAGGPSTSSVRYVAIGSGLTDTEVAADYAAIQAYQTSLGRAL